LFSDELRKETTPIDVHPSDHVVAISALDTPSVTMVDLDISEIENNESMYELHLHKALPY